MRSFLTAGIVAAVILGTGPSPAMASTAAPITASDRCKHLSGLPKHWCGIVDGNAKKLKTASERVRFYLEEVSKSVPPALPDLIRAWRDKIIPYADLIDTGLSHCDPSTWRSIGLDLIIDINRCREAVQPYVSLLAGATIDDKMALTAAQKLVVHLRDAGRVTEIPMADLMQAWRDRIIPYVDLIDTGLSNCDPSTWRTFGRDLATDINKCREAAQPYLSILAGATVDEKIGLIDCVAHPEMAGDIRCNWF
ncbi:hypothetical protein Q0Z83_042420 [Actinoplanes sichuanensis]|uniref:Secreted protein n=1 Tax=Actinoplanes sichuanensis TaxID=512349 RepID=A0ABW4AVE6_9ACTN|nr:hypothetical protein [Actinoplanes sichuanensis]BEL06051.1 hypothetical protein Q0Z83_042420 [Actinoplanes sichuanensis]